MEETPLRKMRCDVEAAEVQHVLAAVHRSHAVRRRTSCCPNHHLCASCVLATHPVLATHQQSKQQQSAALCIVGSYMRCCTVHVLHGPCVTLYVIAQPTRTTCSHNPRSSPHGIQMSTRRRSVAANPVVKAAQAAGRRVLQVVRVQNLRLWSRLVVVKADLEDTRESEDVKDLWLWHGASPGVSAPPPPPPPLPSRTHIFTYAGEQISVQTACTCTLRNLL